MKKAIVIGATSGIGLEVARSSMGNDTTMVVDEDEVCEVEEKNNLRIKINMTTYLLMPKYDIKKLVCFYK